MMVVNSTSTNSSVLIQMMMYVMNQSIIQEENSYNYYYMNIGKATNASKCYGSYGCFELSPPWTSENRPVSLFPEELLKIEPRYPLFTRNNPTKPIYFDLNDDDPVASSGMDPNLPIYIISHGYMEGGDRPWIHAMTKELLTREDCSVIAVDWHRGSGPPYTQAVANIRLVGAMTAHLLNDIAKLTKHGDLKHVHCIGHSLGAHLSGYIGYTLQRDFGLMLGRITGLDPAEPHFAKAQPPVRLDRTAAHYVDIVHTDASQFITGGLGIKETIGHVDYFPNGGTDQPGCGKSIAQYISSESGSFFRGVKKYLSCNHVRSHEFFTESINPTCSFMTISCSTYEDFKTGKCFDCGKGGHHCLKFGYHGRTGYERLLKKRLAHPKKSLVQYFMTGDEKPFCKAHYRITVEISKTEESRQHGGEIGQLWFVFHSTATGEGLKTQKVALSQNRYHEPGVNYTVVVASDEIPLLKAVEVEWQYHSSMFNPLTWRILASPRLFVAKVKVEGLEMKQGITVCPSENKALITGLPQLMLPQYCAM